MSNNNLKLSPVTDLEILDKIFNYLIDLSPNLPFSRLHHHCLGAMVSIFELFFYLKSHNLKDYGNNQK